MTTYNTLLLDQTAWDLVLDSFGNIALAAPPYAIAQDVASAVRTFLGEVYYDTEDGIPWNQEVLGHLPPASVLTQLITEQALRVSGVVTAQTVISSFDRKTRAVTGQIQFVDENNVSQTVSF